MNTLHRGLVSGLAVIWLAAVNTSANAATPAYQLFAIGEARNATGGELLYREYHLASPEEPVHVVEYREPGGRLFASKTLHPGGSAFAPGFIQLDLRSGELLSARWQESALQLGRRADEGATMHRRVVETPDTAPLVIDAGFDQFVRQQWDTLRNGTTVRFDFALPARLGLVSLQARSVPCDGDPGMACFRIAPANSLLRLVVEPIELAYTTSDRRLARFRGIGNIGAGEGDPDVVSITYSYPEAQPLPGCQPLVFIDGVPPLDTLAAGCDVAAGS